MRRLFFFLVILIQFCTLAQSNSSKLNQLKKSVVDNVGDTVQLSKYLQELSSGNHTASDKQTIEHLDFLFQQSRKTKYLRGLAFSTIELGNYYCSAGDYGKALSYLFKGEKMLENGDDYKRLCSINSIIGNCYLGLQKVKEQKIYFSKAYNIAEEHNFVDGMARGAAGMGSAFTEEKNYVESNKWNQIALDIFIEKKQEVPILILYTNIADNLVQMNELDNAEQTLKKAEPWLSKIKHNYALFGYYRIQGILASKKQQYQMAKSNFETALNLMLEDKANHNISEISKLLSESCQKSGDLDCALRNLRIHLQYRDSVFNEKSSQQLLDVEKKYEIEKKDALLQKKNAEIKARTNEQYMMYGGLAFLLIFLAFIFRSNLQKNKANKLLAEQKVIIEEKHKEIKDSINYAERIQRSFLATTEILDASLNDHFVFFKPKDIVSGDFYWASKLNNGNFAITVADSTGHGVPGAIMSIINISSLEKAIESENSPEKILDETRKSIIERLKKDGSIEGGKDGMDCSLMVLNQDRSEMFFASAFNPVVIIRQGKVLEFKGDRMPVGKHENDQNSFTLQHINLEKGDLVYTFTDGFADQFGGEQGKKYLVKNLIDFLCSISTLPMQKQLTQLSIEFNQWMGQNEQVDDVCLIGFRC